MALTYSVSGSIQMLLVGGLLYSIGLRFYRLFFHPLRKIPGPWYAAATSWYEFYYDVVLDGQLVRQYPILHEKYDSGFYQAFGTLKYSIVMLIDPEEHKQRRNTVKSLFSTRQMDQLAPSILDVVRRAMNRAQRSYDRGAPLNIQALWSSVTVDTIMTVLFDRQMNFVDSDEEMPPFLDAMTKFADNFLLTKHFTLMNRLAVGLPMSIAASDGRPTYFDLLLRSNAKMPNGLNREALVDEAFVLCFAGTDTTGIGLSLGTYYLLKNPEKLNKMLDELKTVKTNAERLFEYRELCNLPYLSPELLLAEFLLEVYTSPVISFRKGVAYMEMYLCLANLFTRFNMSLYKTDDNTTQWADGPAARIRESAKVNIDSVKM
ncbi:hypothetical protein COL922a_006655 [Colletotrichum nupharicola]|nr:hypothetical protein COL922a_006655 [Colletotrichum nupharicola]